MKGEWSNITLGDFVTLQRGHDLTEPQRRAGNVPVIGSAGQNGFHDTALAKGPGIVIGRSGASFGQVHFTARDFWPHNTGLYVTDFKGNDPHFAFYFLKAIDFACYNSGSAQPSLNRNFIYPIPICVPNPVEQRAIAHVLGSLDDLIELNRETNELLEEMARALFKSWFVDFDPVRRNKDEGGRMKDENASSSSFIPNPSAFDHLFPDHFQDSELGEIPKGWEVRTIGEVVACVGGGTPSTSEPKFWENGAHHWTTPKDFSSLQAPFLIDTDRRITDAGLAKISSGLLPVGTVLMSSRAPVGYLAIADIPVAINQGFIAMRPNKSVSNYFLLNWCQSNMIEIKNRASGTTFAEISKSAFRPIPIVIPPAKVMDAFTDYVKPFYLQIASNLHESRDLAALRDTLLPKLLSGEVSVAEMESKMEVAR